ncbi:MAG: sodium-dependent transporter [Sumerlaeia bacterium]
MSHEHTSATPTEHQVRGQFTTKIGFALAAVGSAVGLGNIWKFPYIMGESGGAAFILVYLICIALVGIPVLLAEFVIGRHGQTSAVGSFRKIAPGKPWWLNGLLGIVAAFFILSFYSAVAGWVLRYAVLGVTHGYEGVGADQFLGFIDSIGGPVIFQFVVMFLTGAIIFAGIEKGVERVATWMMPVLVVLLLLVVLRALTLPGAGAGVAFMFKPDFSKIDGGVILVALGHAFFTLSIGMGAMITYASYVGKKQNLGTTALTVGAMDTGIAILAGLAIFPAVFAFGMEPDAGPGLLFIMLPELFAQMPLGRAVGIAFFTLVFIAALTSTISILEPVVTYLVDDLNIGRHVATAVSAGIIYVIGIPACLSAHSGGLLGEVKIPFLGGGLSIFDFLDTMSSKFMLPIGGLITCLFIAIAWNRKAASQEVVGEGGNPGHPLVSLWYYLTIVVAPLGVLAVLIYGIRELLNKG